jgi:hypothetical protein
MADASGGFDINQLLQNPLFLGGVAGLLADPNDRARALLGGIQTAGNYQAQQQQAQLRALQLKAMQAQQDFNPSDYMQTTPVAQGSATPNALTASMGSQMPATLGGPIGGQTQMQPGAQQGVSFEPGTPTGRVDMQGLLGGGLQAGFTPAAISQIAAIQDPQTALENQLALKRAEGYTLGPGQARFENGQQVAVNGNAPPNQTMIAIQQAKAARDAAQPGSSDFQMYDQLVKRLSGQQEAEQSQRNFDATQAQRETTNAIREQGQAQSRDQYLQNKTNQFSNQLQKTGVPQAQQQLDYIDQTMAKFKDGDVPGYGRLSSMTPSMLLTEDGQKMRQAVASFANVLLRTRSGAAVTDPEQKRFLEELGTGKGMPEARLKQGLDMMKGLLESEKRNAAAGVSNDVLDYYNSTPGSMDFSPYRKKGGGGVSIDNATADDLAAAIARKKGQ